ncbi:tetratricopeptide repeat protein [Pigmentiphaga aceris]|uniref:Tetratricopeptide repeat protein n=1 Tax=Pigmentiphaga aceris TaxID=1940612 RepID=A0A5C0B6R8_9BURK|nr:tetratricopeptide repeat protein [Pigmentiphaga aceris]
MGFLAAASGDVSRAERIFNGLARLRPGRAYPSVGLAVAWMNAGRAADAVVLLEKAQTSDPEERATLDAWRGFALQLAGRISESRRVLDTLAAKDGDAGVLARGLLGLAQEGK